MNLSSNVWIKKGIFLIVFFVEVNYVGDGLGGMVYAVFNGGYIVFALEGLVKGGVVGEAGRETYLSYGCVGGKNHFACFLQSEVKKELIGSDRVGVLESVDDLVF